MNLKLSTCSLVRIAVGRIRITRTTPVLYHTAAAQR